MEDRKLIFHKGVSRRKNTFFFKEECKLVKGESVSVIEQKNNIEQKREIGIITDIDWSNNTATILPYKKIGYKEIGEEGLVVLMISYTDKYKGV